MRGTNGRTRPGPSSGTARRTGDGSEGAASPATSRRSGARRDATLPDAGPGRPAPRRRLPAPAGERVVFLVPRREDHGIRDELWAYCRRRWETLFPDVPIYEGHHEAGPFNRSAAVNLASDLADEDGPWDVAVVLDSDVFLRRSQVEAAIATARETGRVTWAHRRWRGLREDATRRILDDRRDLGPELEHDLDLLVEKTNPLSWSCCIAVPRPVWDDLGGFDERFRGWGFEDMAFQSVVLGLYGAERVSVLPADEEAVGAVAQTIEDEWGEGDRIREALAPLVRPADVYHLHHPRSEERVQQGRPATTASPDYVDNGRLGRRYMVALRRDYGLHDRAGVETPMDDDERDRDIANLIRDDAHFELLARRANRPDWSDWWPTLDELVEGAKEERFGKTSEVAMVVRTGGEDETFEVRSGYLRRSLASLVERVHGPITRRVIYSDWSERFRPELDAIATEFGFYIVGGGHHGYTPAVRRLWRYLEARVSEPFVFLAEDDFVYLRDVELAPLVDALRRASRIRQIALLRGPCYPREFEEGGILGWPDADFSPAEAGTPRARIEHRLFWTMNPSLFARSIASTAWPQVRSSERAFGDLLLRDPRAVFAFAGDGEPWIEHIGEVRSTDAY